VEIPGIPRSMMKAHTPAAPLEFGSVLAVTVKTSARGALVM
jgi:hypothetical protein